MTLGRRDIIAVLPHTPLDQTNTLVQQGEDDLEQALALVNQLPTLWTQADEEARRDILEAVFVRFVVGEKTVMDVELRAPYNWLSKWEPIWPSRLTVGSNSVSSA